MRAILSVAVFAFAVAFGRADDTYDLRGPGPVKGQVIISSSTLKMKDNDLELSVKDQKIKLKQTMIVTTEEEEEILAVKGRDVVKSKARILKELTKTSMGDDEAEEKSGELEGETILTERNKDGTWSHKLVDGKATEEQEKELKKRNGPENEDELYPAEKVAVGHKWQVDAAKMKSLTGSTFTDVKGKMDQKFVKVEKVNGEECAVVETKGTMTGKLKDDDGSPDAELKITATSWRSLKTGLELKGTFKGSIKIEGKTKINDEEVEMKMVGPIEGSSTAKLK
jgi:ABC-type Fe3+/spermidine/putrescine transport system ATPase subunit